MEDFENGFVLRKRVVAKCYIGPELTFWARVVAANRATYVAAILLAVGPGDAKRSLSYRVVKYPIIQFLSIIPKVRWMSNKI